MWKSRDEDPVPGKKPREEPVCCDGSAPLPMYHTTSELQVGNSLPGAPVKASMSGNAQHCNQGGTVEYICIPPLIFQGVGIFYTLPHNKGGKQNGKRKPVHI